MNRYETDVCIAGAGPAGMVLGLLLAKLGRRVLVLEHHPDFAREYRGEVLMPRFTQMMRQINLFKRLEKYPHLKLEELEGFYHDQLFLRVGFKRIAPDAPFAIWMPQPILLNALYDEARVFPSFQLWFNARAENLIQENGRTAGLKVLRNKEPVEIRAKVTVGADGRFSAVRKHGPFELEDEDHRFDIIWFTLPKPPDYDNRVRFFLSKRYNYLILPKYPDAIQCGLVVEKNAYAGLVKAGVDSIRTILLDSHPLFREFANSLRDFSPFNVLQAKSEYVRRWAADGLLLVGDSAHTCSPAGAIGVSVAVASAIVAAEVIEDCFKKNDFSAEALGKLQALREEEVRHIQSRQKRFGGLLLPQSRFGKSAAPVILWLLAKLNLFPLIQKDLFAMSRPLPIRPHLRFPD